MPEWYEEGLQPEDIADITAKGWNKPVTPELARTIVQSYRTASQLLGVPADQIIRVPKDASDPLYNVAFDRVVGLSIPKTPDEYKFDGIVFKDGTQLDADDQAFVRDFAVKNKLPLPAARALAQELVNRTDSGAEAEASAAAAAQAAREGALVAAWGSSADTNKAAAAKAVDGLQALGIKVDLSGVDATGYVAAMSGLAKLSAQLGEAPLLGAGTGTPSTSQVTGMTAADARNKFEELRGNMDWVNKALTPGTSEAAYFNDLQRVMAGG